MLKQEYRIIITSKSLSGVEDSARVISAPFSAISKKLSDSTLIEVVKKEDLYKEK